MLLGAEISFAETLDIRLVKGLELQGLCLEGGGVAASLALQSKKLERSCAL
jgi:hypothetical protein